MSHFTYLTKPYPHQRMGLSEATSNDEYGFLWEMGTGKTKGMIDVLRYRYFKEDRIMKTLILSPLVTLFNWKNEFKMHSTIPQDDILVLHKGGTKGKSKTLLRAAENKVTKELDKNLIAITNYEAMISKDFFALIQEWNPEIIICDESHYLKSHQAKRSKQVAKIADRARYRYILTGTPILNNIKDIFMQFRILDGGSTFGKNFSVFMATYMEDENRAWANRPGYFPKYTARLDKFGELTEKIYTKCMRVTKEECLKNLPPLVKTIRHVELGPEQKKYYLEMKRDFVTFVREKRAEQELNGAVIAQLAVTKALRLMQIVSGYVTTDEGEEINIQKNPRLMAVKELLEELTPRHKVILWCSFRNNYRQLGKLLKDMGINHVFITGEDNLDQKQEAMDSFQSDPDVRVVVANRRAAGIGINLTAAAYSIVYSRNFSLGEELQSEARNHRGGSEIHSQVVKVDLVARDTIDEEVMQALANKQDISTRIIDMIEKED